MFAVVSQSYTVNLVEENVLRGNAAIFKCLIPSFVTEYVSVTSWIVTQDAQETEFSIDNNVKVEGESVFTAASLTPIRPVHTIVCTSMSIVFSGISGVHG